MQKSHCSNWPSEPYVNNGEQKRGGKANHITVLFLFSFETKKLSACCFLEKTHNLQQAKASPDACGTATNVMAVKKLNKLFRPTVVEQGGP
ncbi:hypothetical protein [uncultured Bartonella sp.]|uniref:hypothetical protein n=1 Tax=uncultured Bartonella sp. TaxID=104108 RepID=UPI0026324D5A|nr:hypothetical protein [uncultured Bartonella sp.]